METITIQVTELERIVTSATKRAVKSVIEHYEKKGSGTMNFNRNFKIVEAAKILGVTRQTLNKRIERRESLIRFNKQNLIYGQSLKAEFERIHGQENK